METENEMDFSHVATGDKLTLRCGGKVLVQRVAKGGSARFPIVIRIYGYQGTDGSGWCYDKTGQHGEGTGINGSPFDVLKIEHEPVVIHLIPNTK